MATIRVTDGLTEAELDTLHGWLSEAYWSRGRSRETQAKASCGSMHFLAESDGALVGYARVVTDRATFGWVCDVFVAPDARAQGVGKALMQAIIEHPDLAGIRRLILATRDAHGLYAQFGFVQLPNADRWMARQAEGAS